MSVQVKNEGRITQIIGPVMDIAFSAGNMPNIYNSLVVEGKKLPAAARDLFKKGIGETHACRCQQSSLFEFCDEKYALVADEPMVASANLKNGKHLDGFRDSGM